MGDDPYHDGCLELDHWSERRGKQRVPERTCMIMLLAVILIIGCWIAISVYNLTHPNHRILGAGPGHTSRVYFENDQAPSVVPSSGPNQATRMLAISNHERLSILKAMDRTSRAEVLSYMAVKPRIELLRMLYTGEQASIINRMQRKFVIETLVGMDPYERKAVTEALQSLPMVSQNAAGAGREVGRNLGRAKRTAEMLAGAPGAGGGRL